MDIDGQTELKPSGAIERQEGSSSIVARLADQAIKICELSLMFAEQQRQIEELHPKAMIDELTGCSTRTAFGEYVKEKFDPEKNDRKVGIVFIDLNKLKDINDTHGHKTGDVYLRETADAFRSSISNIGQGDLYRMGGDEFMIVIENHLSEDPDAFRKEMQEYIQQIKAEHPKLDFASGTAVFDRSLDENLNHTISRADKRMYGEKKGIVNPNQLALDVGQ